MKHRWYLMENLHIEMINNKTRHNLINEKCRWCSDRLDGAGSFWELLGQTKVIQIRQRETQDHQGAITHETCCLAAQLTFPVPPSYLVFSTQFMNTPFQTKLIRTKNRVILRSEEVKNRIYFHQLNLATRMVGLALQYVRWPNI